MGKQAAGFLIYRLVEREIEYLFLKASYGDRHWTPPKGHVDEGEDFYTTALRETQEEAGFTEKDLKIHKHLKKTLTYNVNNKLKVVVYWLAELISDRDPTLSEEHTEFKYLKMSEIPDFSPFPDFNDMACWFEKEIKKLHADGSY